MPDSADPTQHVVPYVLERSGYKALHFSMHELQSRMRLHDPQALDLEYTRTMMGFLLFRPAPQDIVMVGLGGGSLAKFCYRHLTRAQIQVVEINPHVIALRDEFQVPGEDARFSVQRGDGARFVRDNRSCCDVLLVDGFDSQGLPEQLCSQRFYDDCLAALRPEGVLAVNLHFGHLDFTACVDRLRRSFDDAVFVVDGADLGNSIVFAVKSARRGKPRLAPAALRRRLDTLAAGQLRTDFARVAAALHAQVW